MGPAPAGRDTLDSGTLDDLLELTPDSQKAEVGRMTILGFIVDSSFCSQAKENQEAAKPSTKGFGSIMSSTVSNR